MFDTTKIKVIAFDADDTLWVNEPIFTSTHEKFSSLLDKYVPAEVLEKTLYETEIKNLSIFGYGVKGFTLSMVETAVELSEGKVTAQEIEEILKMGKEMLTHPVEVLEGVEQTLKQLQEDYELMVITKGDLFDQESKVARSGLTQYFSKVEVVSDKAPQVYEQLLQKHGLSPDEFLMVGNSLKSDILPVLTCGAAAIHIPFHTTWEHEQVEEHHLQGMEYWEASDVREVPAFLKLPQKSESEVAAD